MIYIIQSQGWGVGVPDYWHCCFIYHWLSLYQYHCISITIVSVYVDALTTDSQHSIRNIGTAGCGGFFHTVSITISITSTISVLFCGFLFIVKVLPGQLAHVMYPCPVESLLRCVVRCSLEMWECNAEPGHQQREEPDTHPTCGWLQLSWHQLGQPQRKPQRIRQSVTTDPGRRNLCVL